MDPLQPLIDNLHADGRPRVWSLVITVFGDSVQPRGGRIATARLSRLLGRIGIETGALRTALSRLSRDGWVDSRRAGRSSSYALSQRGAREFTPATARIYAAPAPGAVRVWTFQTTPADGALRVAGGWLLPAGRAAATQGFGITGALSSGAADAVWRDLDDGHRRALECLAADLQALAQTPADPLDCAAARTLLIHRWRKIVLRWPPVPPELLCTRLHPADLHGGVARAYARLSPGAEAWLDSGAGDMTAMPVPGPDFARRFGGLQIP